MSKDPKEPPYPPRELFPYDEMSTGESSSLVRRAQVLTGAPDAPLPPDPALKPITGVQLAFRPSAPPATRPGAGPPTGKSGLQPAFTPTAGKSGAHPAHAPTTGKSGLQPAFTPTAGKSGAHPAHAPTTGKSGLQPAFTPTAGKSGAHPPVPGKSGLQPAHSPLAVSPSPGDEETGPVDPERLQRQIRALSLTDSAHAHTRRPVPRPSIGGPSADEDTFTRKKMKQAEDNMPSFDLDEDLG